MSFDEYIPPRNHHHYQDIEYFHLSRKLSHSAIQSIPQHLPLLLTHSTQRAILLSAQIEVRGRWRKQLFQKTAESWDASPHPGTGRGQGQQRLPTMASSRTLYNWNHLVCTLLGVASFAQYNASEIHHVFCVSAVLSFISFFFSFMMSAFCVLRTPC